MSEKEKFLQDYNWKKIEVKYNQHGHSTREGWVHPSKVFKQPVSLETAYDFTCRYVTFLVWWSEETLKELAIQHGSVTYTSSEKL